MILAVARLGVVISEEDKQYTETRFSAEILKEVVAARGKTDLSSQQLRVEHDDSEWTYDTVEEFLADFRKYRGYAYCSIYGGNFDLSVTFTRRDCTVSMKASSRSDIETVFDIFEKPNYLRGQHPGT